MTGERDGEDASHADRAARSIGIPPVVVRWLPLEPAFTFSRRIPMGMETIITCAVTGGSPISPGSAVPITPEQIADECLAAAEAGAAIVHIHVRDPSTGKASMDTDLYAQVVSQIRS